MPMDVNNYRRRCRSQFSKLLARADARNRLYYLLNLLNRWGAVGPLSKRPSASSMDFNTEANLLTTALILQPITHGHAIPANHSLFALQVNLEAKGFYAVIRNFVNTCRSTGVHPEPWRSSDFGGPGLSTTKVIRNVSSELRSAGFAALSNELKRTHLVDVAPIRHAVAHGNLRTPCDDTKRKWVFGDYVGSPPHVYVRTKSMTTAAFLAIVRRFFAFRLAFFDAAADAAAALTNQSYAFKAANQNKRTEKLDCRFDRGAIMVKYRGTPLW